MAVIIQDILNIEATPELDFQPIDLDYWYRQVEFLELDQTLFGISFNIMEQLKQSLLGKILKCEDYLKEHHNQNDITQVQKNLQFFNYTLFSFNLKIQLFLFQ